MTHGFATSPSDGHPTSAAQARPVRTSHYALEVSGLSSLLLSPLPTASRGSRAEEEPEGPVLNGH